MPGWVDNYPPIADHGLIGNLQTGALVDSHGTIDFYCCPRFDAPTVFASLLDDAKGGHFGIWPANDDYVTKQLYHPDTGILITRLMSDDGVAEITDFMPIEAPNVATDRHSIVRMLSVPRGQVTLRFEVAPRFDYGRAEHTLDLTTDGAVFTGADLSLTLHSTAPLERRDDDVIGTLTLAAGDVAGFVLESNAGSPRALAPAELEARMRETARWWRHWLASSSYRGRWREAIARSAITLKLLTYAPTGAPVAALTAGLPELIGGERNWDYRYTWIRDGSLTVQALARLGFEDEALAFMMWLRDRVEAADGGPSGPLEIMYRVDGTSDLVEGTLDHFEGYRGSAPVRIGNGASGQLQLDTYGEALDAMWHAERIRPVIARRGWRSLCAIVDWICANWDQPEEGLWEVRGGRQSFVYGRMMCWVALDRAIRLAVSAARPAPLERWTAARDAINEQIVAKGWNSERNALVQHYDTDVLDASVLAAARVGFLVTTDEMWIGTLDGIERELVSDSLVYRYNPEASPDGLRGSEGTFSMCTFWYVDALTRSGRLETARLTFEKMLTYANHLGLFGEEMGLTCDQLGNFPQAFTHLSLINAAVGLDAALG